MFAHVNRYFIVILAYCLGVLALVVLSDIHLPQPVTLEEANTPENKGRFVEERARGHLKKITSFGPRPAGTVKQRYMPLSQF